MDFEAEDLGNVALGGFGRNERGVDLEQDVVEGCTEVGAVDGSVAARLGIVHVLAAGAPQLDGLQVGNVGQAHGQQRVRVAVDAGTFAKVGLLVLLELLSLLVSRSRRVASHKDHNIPSCQDL